MVLRIVSIVVGVLFLFTGVVWILQGTDVLTQGFMAGQSRWTGIGSAVVVVGVILILLGSIKRKGRPGSPAA
jgi:multisubunit Na+/H+ antiporter MnhG subunit